MLFSKKFIAANREVCDYDHHVPAPYVRRAFSLDFVPDTATITIAGLGFYELTVNGTNITKGPLAPYISNPDDIIYYDSYDIAPLLRRGRNAVGILLGNGMRNAFGGGVWDFEQAHSRGPVCLALAIEAAGEGKTFLLEADDTFRTHPSPVTFNDLRMGCRYDARLEIPGWDLAEFDDRDWTPAEPCPSPAGDAVLCTAEPIAVTRTLRAVDIRHYDELPFGYENTMQNAAPIPETVRQNVYVYDFGENNAGVTVLHIHGKPGQKITIRHGEYLQNGGHFSVSTTIFPKSARWREKYLTYGQCDEYICRGGDETFVPRFKYDGFRYAYVEGLTLEQATPDALTFRVMTSDFPERARFSSSDDTLNALYDMTCRSDRSNFFYFPTDCPHREKNGWTGDASMSAEHMLLHMQAENSLRVWLANIRKAQREDGAIPGIIPTGGWGFAWGNGPVFDSVLFNLPLEIYRHTGDKAVLLENLPAMLRYLSYASTRRDARGLCAYGLGDWNDPFRIPNGKITAPLELTDTVMLFDCAKKAAFLFREAGRLPEAAFAACLADEFRDAVRAHLIDFSTMTAAGDCETSQAFCLATGIFTEEETPAATRRFLEIFHRAGDLNTGGLVGLRYIFHVLNRAGEADLAYRAIVSPERTGYGSFVRRGNTTLPEYFAWDDGTDAWSQNHHFYGDILSVMIQEFAGLRPNPSYRDPLSFEIAPCFAAGLSHAEAAYTSAAGELSVAWRRDGKDIHLTVSVPDGMHGNLVLPTACRTDGPLALSGGAYTYRISV